MEFKMSIKSDLAKVQKQFLELAKKEVVVGIPQESNSKRGKITNAELLFIHEHGSPIKNIPPRPVLKPAIENNKDKIKYLYQEEFKNLMSLKSNPNFLNELGLFSQNAIRDRFTNNDWQPLMEATIEKKGSSNPLIDTGELRKSITYVVRNSTNEN